MNDPPSSMNSASERLASTIVGGVAGTSTPREQVGAVVGPYKLLQQLGEGGFGIVYMAEQEKPVRRVVALKIIKPGMDTAQVIARFESERQALALMDHPNIARVLDAGATDSGHPYFVMELVRGVPITEYCDKNHLAPEERLKLFINVCHAIQHAQAGEIIGSFELFSPRLRLLAANNGTGVRALTFRASSGARRNRRGNPTAKGERTCCERCCEGLSASWFSALR
jgi:Protein kinase domain